MAKKSGAKKQPKKVTNGLRKFWQNNWFAVLLIVVLVGVLGFIGVNKMIINNQKKQFEQAEKSLDTLYADIVKNVGQPADMKKDKSCGYQSTVWGNGNLGCGINYYMTYLVSSIDQANTIRQNVFHSLGLQMQVTYSRNNSFVDKLNTLPANNPAANFICPGVISCNISINYHDPDDLSSMLYKNKEVVIEISAGSSAKAEFYPVKN